MSKLNLDGVFDPLVLVMDVCFNTLNSSLDKKKETETEVQKKNKREKNFLINDHQFNNQVNVKHLVRPVNNIFNSQDKNSNTSSIFLDRCNQDSLLRL